MLSSTNCNSSLIYPSTLRITNSIKLCAMSPPTWLGKNKNKEEKEKTIYLVAFPSEAQYNGCHAALSSWRWMDWLEPTGQNSSKPDHTLTLRSGWKQPQFRERNKTFSLAILYFLSFCAAPVRETWASAVTLPAPHMLTFQQLTQAGLRTRGKITLSSKSGSCMQVHMGFSLPHGF